jgi:eukaryotic-like serine/threonine-protein kinase
MSRRERIRNLFDCAMEQPRSIRERFVRSLLPEESDILDEVLQLIKAHDDAPDYLDEPLVNFGRDGAPPADPRGSRGTATLKPGLCIGTYRLTRPIGAGGMSTVWLAERADGRFDYLVAVKLLGLCHSPALAKRFRTEQRALASLQHPYIARLIDAGNTDSSVPYFIMEYVEGRPIDQYCRANNLTVNERLELFLKVCEAVEYAHRKMVIHRDLKPNNILVDMEHRPRLLDFGIAKLIHNQDDTPVRSDSTTGLRSFTPDYASPEQWQGGTITPATDVYSLGAVLYELLAGCRLQSRYVQKSTDNSYERVEPVAPPSEAFLRRTVVPEPNSQHSSRPDRSTDPPRKGHAGYASDPRTIYNQMSGDIDHIVLKAVEFHPQDRYQTVAQFAEDIRRFLECRPIDARSPGTFYRAGRFVRRNPGLVAGIAVAAMGLISAIIGVTFGLF